MINEIPQSPNNERRSGSYPGILVRADDSIATNAVNVGSWLIVPPDQVGKQVK